MNHNRYVAHLMENSPVGTALYFGDGQNPQVTDNDQVYIYFSEKTG